MSSEKNLIVNADDYGLTREVSRGIRYAHKNGIVSSTTAMMNMEGVKDDLQLAYAETPALGIGVHLILTAGAPVLPISEVGTLVDQNGQFPKIRTIYDALKNMNQEHVYKEWKAQIEAFLETGHSPDHLDSHHHVSYLDNMLFQTMLMLAREFNLPIRKIPDQTTSGLIGIVPENLEQRQKNDGISSPDYFESRFYGDPVNEVLLATIIRELGKGTTEMMTHPGFVDDVLHAKSSYNDGRKTELSILGSRKSKKLIQELGVNLTTFRSLK